MEAKSKFKNKMSSNNTSHINAFLKYWDNWFKLWYKNAKSYEERPNDTNGEKAKIKDWEIPLGKGGNEEEIWRYYPEPYWSNLSENTKAIILNINPGKGRKGQDIKLNNSENLFKDYEENGCSYEGAMKKLTENADNKEKTNEWMEKYRIKWLSNLLDEELEISDIFCAELVPWHTEKKTHIKEYAYNSSEQIYKFVIEPLSKAAGELKESSIKHIIIARGTLILEILNKYYNRKKIIFNNHT